jgi:DNA-binding NarL/FixJ family response regulator
MPVEALHVAYRIYVVEDSPILLRPLREVLAGIPGALVVGHSGRAEIAIAEIAESIPHAVIVDLMLQSGTGFDVLEAVARQGTKAPIAIVLTNFTMAPYHDRAASLGAAYFFDKSTEIPQMVRVVTALAREHEMRGPLKLESRLT